MFLSWLLVIVTTDTTRATSEMNNLACIPERPFYSLTNSCPGSPDSGAPPLYTPSNSGAPHLYKRIRHSTEPYLKQLATQIIPTSTKPTRIQQLQRSIKEAWEARFTPKRLLDELYIPGVLYATRARFVRSEEDFWALSRHPDQGAV